MPAFVLFFCIIFPLLGQYCSPAVFVCGYVGGVSRGFCAILLSHFVWVQDEGEREEEEAKLQRGEDAEKKIVCESGL